MAKQETQDPKRRRLKWVFIVIATSIVALFFGSINWWRVSFRESAVLGMSEVELQTRFGPPDYDSRRTPHDRRQPTNEAERLELGLDDDTTFDLIWITGLGGSNAVVRLESGQVVGVRHESHR